MGLYGIIVNGFMKSDTKGLTECDVLQKLLNKYLELPCVCRVYRSISKCQVFSYSFFLQILGSLSKLT